MRWKEREMGWEAKQTAGKHWIETYTACSLDLFISSFASCEIITFWWCYASCKKRWWLKQRGVEKFACNSLTWKEGWQNMTSSFWRMSSAATNEHWITTSLIFSLFSSHWFCMIFSCFPAVVNCSTMRREKRGDEESVSDKCNVWIVERRRRATGLIETGWRRKALEWDVNFMLEKSM